MAEGINIELKLENAGRLGRVHADLHRARFAFRRLCCRSLNQTHW